MAPSRTGTTSDARPPTNTARVPRATCSANPWSAITSPRGSMPSARPGTTSGPPPCDDQSMIRKSGSRFSVKIMLKKISLGSGSTQLNQILTRAVDDHGAELVAFFHRKMRLHGFRQRKLRGDIVDARPGCEPFGDIGLSGRKQRRRQREQYERA